MAFRHVAPVLAALCGISVALPARALEPGEIDDEPVHLDVTESGSLLYNFDNRNFKANSPSTATDDKWGMFYNRLNLQASWSNWQVGLRLDGVWFYTAPTADGVAQRMVDNRPPPLPGEIRDPADQQQYYTDQRDRAAADLSTRYRSIFYPAKYYVTYSTPDGDFTVGDLYAQLGRGLVLSLRKYDELASDTTARGARASGHIRSGDARVDVTLVGGALNPLRVDEASGRMLSVDPGLNPRPALGHVDLFGDRNQLMLAEAGMPRPEDGNSPLYFTDRIVAAQIEAGTRSLVLGTQGSALIRNNPPGITVIAPPDVHTVSESLGIPDIDGHGAAYVEAAYQVRHSNTDSPPLQDPGHAIYTSLSVIQKPVTVLFEGKHFRRFFALDPNIGPGAGEFSSVLRYSTPPTTESVWTDTEFGAMASCVTGGRLRTDVAATDNDTIYVWVGRYNTWAEATALNLQCDTADANLNRVWDFAIGLEKTAHARKSRANITVGARDDRTAGRLSPPSGENTNVFYREGYLRYDIIEWISGPFSVQLQGWHRYRKETMTEPKPWFEGEQLTGFQWAPHIVIAAGVEYDTRESVPNTYFNGQVRYAFTPDTSVNLFVGQRRGAFRCVSGVCRQFPPFEGARLDFTARF